DAVRAANMRAVETSTQQASAPTKEKAPVSGARTLEALMKAYKVGPGDSPELVGQIKAGANYLIQGESMQGLETAILVRSLTTKRPVAILQLNNAAPLETAVLNPDHIISAVGR